MKSYKTYLFIYGSLLLFASALITSCAYTPLLKKDEYLLHNQNIKGNEAIAKDKLTPLYQQVPNRKFFGKGTKTYLYFYLIGRKAFDTANVSNEIKKTTIEYEHKKTLYAADSLKLTKITKKYNIRLEKLERKKTEGNYMMRVVGEPPSLFDTTNVNETLSQFQNYYYTKGYFNSEISYEADTIGKNVSVIYKITEGTPLKISNITYEIEDTIIASICKKDSSNRLLKPSMNYDESLFNLERDRTFKLLKDNGYYLFTKNYIFLDIDTTGLQNTARLYFIIKNPEKGIHKQFYYKKVMVNIDKGRKGKYHEESVFNDIEYNLFYKKYSKKILDNKIDIRKNKLYSASSVQKTQNKMSQLQMFKYTNITFTVENDSLVASINASSLPKFQLNDEFGVNTNINRQIPGPYGSITFTNRNTFKGCEILDLSFSAGIEGQISNTDDKKFIRTTEINGNSGLNFPILLLPGKLKHLYSNYNPRTRIAINVLSSLRPDYNRTEVKANISYQLQPNTNSRIIIAPLELNLINAIVKDTIFQNQLELLQSQGSNILSNFKKSLVTDFAVTFIHNNNNPLINKKSHFFKTTAEIGGLTPTLIANLTNETVTQNDKLFGLPYYKYFKLTADYRYYLPILKKSTFAIRLSSGYVSTIRDNGNGVPYIKLLYAGGLNSNRAWRTRRLGPGSFVRTNPDGSFNYKTEQPGEINLESNVEGRFKIWKWIGIGVFTDVSNVWTIKYESNRPGSQFKLDEFYKQLAVGSGLGLRLDFSFFVIRVDAGIKAYDPAQVEGERFRLLKLKPIDFNPNKNKDAVIYNFGIGYPF